MGGVLPELDTIPSPKYTATKYVGTGRDETDATFVWMDTSVPTKEDYNKLNKAVQCLISVLTEKQKKQFAVLWTGE